MGNIKFNIKNLSLYLPKKIVKNSQLDKRFNLKKNTLFYLTGIKERRVCFNHENTEIIAIKAALKCIRSYKKKINITHLITVTNTPSVYFPSVGHYVLSKIQKYLLKKPFNIPLNCGCSGYVDALILAHKFICNNKKSKILIVTSDTYSKYILPTDKSVLPLFGDGASASIIEYDKNGWTLENEFSESIPNTEDNLIFKDSNGKKIISMKGPELINFAIRDVVPMLLKLIKKEKNLTIFSHQASKIVLNLMKKEILKFNKNIKMPLSYESTGNLVSSSIPLLLKNHFKLLKKSKKIIISGFGVGLTHSHIKLKK